MRQVFASEWTVAFLCCFLLISHLWWFAVSEHQGDVVSGLGGGLAALGVYLATQPYIRKGLRETAKEQVGLRHPGECHEDAPVDEAETEGVRHVVKERVVGVAFIALGSVLNGYGPAVAHLFSLRGA